MLKQTLTFTLLPAQFTQSFLISRQSESAKISEPLSKTGFMFRWQLQWPPIIAFKEDCFFPTGCIHPGIKPYHHVAHFHARHIVVRFVSPMRNVSILARQAPRPQTEIEKLMNELEVP